MCGPAINALHLLIGPVIIAATYFNAPIVLYALGGAAVVYHLYKLITRTASSSPSMKYDDDDPAYKTPRNLTSSSPNVYGTAVAVCPCI